MLFSSTCLFFKYPSKFAWYMFFEVNEGNIFFQANNCISFRVLSVMQHKGEAKSYETLHTNHPCHQLLECINICSQ